MFSLQKQTHSKHKQNMSTFVETQRGGGGGVTDTPFKPSPWQQASYLDNEVGWLSPLCILGRDRGYRRRRERAKEREREVARKEEGEVKRLLGKEEREKRGVTEATGERGKRDRGGEREMKT